MFQVIWTSADPLATDVENEPGLVGKAEPKTAAPDQCALSLTFVNLMTILPSPSAVTAYWRQSARQGPPAAE